jgi:integrase
VKKRTYGTGSFRKLPSGNYQLRYKGETEVVEAANDKAADRALRAWVDKRDQQAQGGPAVPMSKLFDLHLSDLRRMKRKDIITVKRRIEGHLAEFGNLDASKIRKTHIREYIDKRVEAGASNGTINRELSAIRRSLNLGLEEELVPRVPVIKPLKESDPRQGFVEEALYRAMLRELPPHAQPLWVFSYFTGMRLGEVRRLERAWFDWTRMVIVIPERLNKNNKRRYIPVYDDMVPVAKMAWTSGDPACPFLFQRDGKKIKSIRSAMENAAARLKQPILFHDLRRTAVRNMERAGIPRRTAMQVSGHLTESVYIRYSIGKEDDALEVGQQMATYHAKERAKQAEAEKLWHESWHAGPDSQPGSAPPEDGKYRN